MRTGAGSSSPRRPLTLPGRFDSCAAPFLPRTTPSEASISIGQLIEALRTKAEHDTHPTASPDDISRTEAAIGRLLPDSYKQFVGDFSNGAYLFLVQEVSAVGDGNPQIAAIQNIERIGAGTADEVIPLTSTTPLLRYLRAEAVRKAERLHRVALDSRHEAGGGHSNAVRRRGDLRRADARINGDR
jgi:hypothetical protein